MSPKIANLAKVERLTAANTSNNELLTDNMANSPELDRIGKLICC
jgi:hypothetical protein